MMCIINLHFNGIKLALITEIVARKKRLSKKNKFEIGEIFE
ncbi:MAG: hypothetical protein WC162_07285 [Sphaerochaetaceae bacterium]